MDEKLLKQANIPEEHWPFCKIENGVIYTPNTEVLYKNGLATEEQYQAWKQAQQIDICPVKTTEQRLEELVEQVNVMDELIANIMMEM